MQKILLFLKFSGLADLLEHSSVNVTLNIYAHVLESMEQTAPNMWGQILKGKVE